MRRGYVMSDIAALEQEFNASPVKDKRVGRLYAFLLDKGFSMEEIRDFYQLQPRSVGAALRRVGIDPPRKLPTHRPITDRVYAFNVGVRLKSFYDCFGEEALMAGITDLELHPERLRVEGIDEGSSLSPIRLFLCEADARRISDLSERHGNVGLSMIVRSALESRIVAEGVENTFGRPPHVKARLAGHWLENSPAQPSNKLSNEGQTPIISTSIPQAVALLLKEKFGKDANRSELVRAAIDGTPDSRIPYLPTLKRRKIYRHYSSVSIALTLLRSQIERIDALVDESEIYKGRGHLIAAMLVDFYNLRPDRESDPVGDIWFRYAEEEAPILSGLEITRMHIRGFISDEMDMISA
jgi:hypothetical protein